MSACLHLADGSLYSGSMFGASSEVSGEVVFSTGMVGYPESLTDPSYRGQILVLTWPLAGSYGVPSFKKGSTDFESDRIQVSGLIVTSHMAEFSHHNAERSLGDWLKAQGVPAMEGVDTRELTRRLRESGTMPGRIAFSPDSEFGEFTVKKNLVEAVSTSSPELINPPGSPRVALLDCGCKRSIIAELVKRGCSVLVLPYQNNLDDLEADGLLLSNGPGDPASLVSTISNLRSLFQSGTTMPVRGICLGCQLMALAAGGSTEKLPYGHRSQNQPVQYIWGGACRITSQNHGYAVVEDSLPEWWRVSISNLNDGTVEGIEHTTMPWSAVQYHPEGAPGPLDSLDFFDDFLGEVVNHG